MTGMRVWRKGDQSPEKGVPFRHTRDRAVLLLDGATPAQLDATLRTLIAADPRPVLEALAAVITEDEEGGGHHERQPPGPASVIAGR